MEYNCFLPKYSTIILLLLVLFFAPYTLQVCCAGGSGTTGATFLKLGVGSRPIAMGEAFTAVADDVNALYWNPAGLAQIQKKEVSLIQTIWFQSIYYEYLGYCQPLLGGVIGSSATFLWIDGIERRSSDTPNPEGWIPARDLAATVSYGKTISSKFNAGVTLKIIHQQLDDKTATGVVTDLGLLYNIGKEKWTLGIALQNLGYESAFISEQSPMPLNVKIGISNKYLSDKSGNYKPDTGNYKLTLAADINYGIMDNVWSVGGGIDWWIFSAFAIRCGYKYSNATSSLGWLSGLTCGAGFKINYFDIDYALVPYGDLGLTHRISLIAKF